MKKEKTLKKIPKSIPLWIFIMVIVLALIPAIYAVLTVTTRTYTSLFGEVIEVSEDLNVVPKGIDIEPAPKSAVTNVTLGTPLAKGRTALTRGDYSYSVEVIVANISANTRYNCSLYQEQAGAWIYIDSLYVLQSGTPAVGDGANLKWDIGVSLQSSAYKLVIETY
jgi:hypothetical protein